MDINPKTVPEQARAGATVIENLIIRDLQHNWESQLNSCLDIPGLEVWQQASQMYQQPYTRYSILFTQ